MNTDFYESTKLHNARKEIKIFTDMMSEGFIVIDKKGVIQVYNKSAMDIFRINHETELSHGSDLINKGDIVIMCDNSFGEDDGQLNLEDLGLLGMHNDNLDYKDGILLISKFKDLGFNYSYKIIKSNEKIGIKELTQEIEGVKINSKIDFNKKLVSISVNDKDYNMKYINSIGHMVILEKDSLKVKFFQHYGYTARKECIKDILYGKNIWVRASTRKNLN